jgi:hypothetical protein
MVFNNTDVRAGWYIFKYRIRIQECGEDEDMQLVCVTSDFRLQV